MNQNPIINETENAATENIDATNIASETPPLSSEPCELTGKIVELTNQVATLENELLLAKQSERDTVLRAKAEVENMRRRTESEIEKNHKFAIEKFATTLLPVIDSLERAIELSNPESSELQAIHEGLALTLTTFNDALSKFNIVVVDQMNVPFDPAIHEAMTIMESAEHSSNHVVLVMQKGYTLNGRLLRPARVAISK